MGISDAEYIALQDRLRRNGAVSDPDPEPMQADADILEDPIQEECTKILESDGWRALRTDPVSDRGRGKGFGEPGMADYLYLRYNYQETLGRFCGESVTETLWIEYKRSAGGIVSKTQRLWHARERVRGALTLIAGEDFAPSVAGFLAWYQGSGLQRRKNL